MAHEQSSIHSASIPSIAKKPHLRFGRHLRKQVKKKEGKKGEGGGEGEGIDYKQSQSGVAALRQILHCKGTFG